MKYPKLRKCDREFLKWKYHSNGLSWEKAQEIVDNRVEYLKNLITTLKTKNKTPLEIESRFRKEFEKICMKAEAGTI